MIDDFCKGVNAKITFADAGVAEEAAALLAEGALSHWTALYGAIVPLLPAE